MRYSLRVSQSKILIGAREDRISQEMGNLRVNNKQKHERDHRYQYYFCHAPYDAQ